MLGSGAVAVRRAAAAAAVRTPAMSQHLRVQARGMAIAVDHVARVTRFHVKDEPTAEKVDALTNKLVEAYKSPECPPGFVKLERTVCKTEWAYEIAAVFKASGFGGYMESEFRKNETLPILETIKTFATDETYSGNRVFDEYS